MRVYTDVHTHWGTKEKRVEKYATSRYYLQEEYNQQKYNNVVAHYMLLFFGRCAMKKLKILSIGVAVLSIAILVTWAIHGFQVYTKTSQPVTTTDELFGTTSVTWEPGFWLGIDYAGPAIVALIALVAGYWWYLRRSGTR